MLATFLVADQDRSESVVSYHAPLYPQLSDKYVPVGTYLYLWYGYNLTSHQWSGGNGTSHWNDGTNIVVDTPDYDDCKTASPNACYYASDNNSTLAWQLSDMKQAGISVIILSWWGTGNTTQSSSPTIGSAIDNATLNFFKYLQSTQNLWSFKVAIMVDAFYNSTRYAVTASDWAHIYGYLDARYYQPYANLIFSWGEKPLIMFFNAPGVNNVTQLPLNSTFTTRLVGNGFGPPPQHLPGWFFWEGDGNQYLDANGTSAPIKNYNYAPQVADDGMVGIIPRYDDFYQRPSSYMRYDYTYSQGMYSAQWNYLIHAPGLAQLVLIYGWNEYHERSQLEPHYDRTAPSGFSSGVDETARNVAALEKATVFDYTLTNNGPTTASPGSTVTARITVTLTSGQTQSVNPYCMNPMPPGIMCNWVTVEVFPTANADLLITVAQGTMPGNVTIQVSAIPLGGTTTPTYFTLIITPPSKPANTVLGLDPTEFYGVLTTIAIVTVTITLRYRFRKIKPTSARAFWSLS